MTAIFDPARGFGVYVHWPYCTRICPYCDFNVYAAKARDNGPLMEAIVRDLEGWRERTGARAVDAVFLGGGTPSLLPGADVGRLLERIDALWGVRPGAEITLEANPDDAGRFAEHAAAGVNRLSLGVQSLDDGNLRFLGRTHSAAVAMKALETAKGQFGSVSLDLIYALPDQTVKAWEGELARALALAPDHLSLYELSIEPGAAFARAVKREDWTPADDDRAADLYETTQAMCETAGYPAYEISNHARAPEHESRHNRIYWRSGDWAAVGPGAHGRLTADGERLAIEAADKPGAYVQAVASSGTGWAVVERLTLLDQARERLAMGLRVVEGVDVASMEAGGHKLDHGQVAELERLGLLTLSGGRIALTAKGRLAADRVVAMISP